MGRQEKYRTIDRVPHISFNEAVERLFPHEPKKAKKFMAEQGVWPEAVRSIRGYSPDTYRGNRNQLWVELEEVENLARIFSRN